MTRAKVGDRVRMVGVMRDDPAPMEVGAEGTVKWVHETLMPDMPYQYHVNWDNGRSLMLLPNDPFIVLPSEPGRPIEPDENGEDHE